MAKRQNSKELKPSFRITTAEKEVFVLKTGNMSAAIRDFINAVNTDNIDLIRKYFKNQVLTN